MKRPTAGPVLAFDCACAALSVAVLRQGALLASREEAMATGQAAGLAPMIEAVLAEAGVAARELSLVGVTIGPGSFTGIRIGLAMARGLGLALAIPVAGRSTFDAALDALAPATRLALAQDGVVPIVAIDSRRDEIFIAFAGAEAAERAHVATPAAAIAALPPGRYALVGDGAAAMLAAFAAAGRGSEARLLSDAPPQAAAFGAVLDAQGAAFWRESNRAHGLPRPLYLRGADVTLPKAAVPA